MARFYPIYIRRSDGRLEVVSKGAGRESNQPSPEQMDQSPDKNGVSDFYREVAPDEVKHLEWRRKLGGMLARELQWKDKSSTESGYILVTFPENYRLFEHIKKSEKDGKTEVKSKTHAAGGNDRQDAYLYGHPSGRRKRYRSPADYFPHLLWLCTDESSDPDNCSCKICCPEELDTIVPSGKVVKKAEEKIKTPKLEAATLKREPTPSIPTPIQQRQPSIDQQIDSQFNGFKYRQGELCWFKRGAAWGLGVVLRRWSTNNLFHYRVQPLSHPGNKQLAVTLSSDEELRPWLAWSVPRFTHNGLNDITPPPQYELVNWAAIEAGSYGMNGDLDVDGSILAAKSIDTSYTPFDPIQHVEQTGETYYAGIFLGAEKIWLGEPIRISATAGEVMIVKRIVERPANGAVDIQLIGDIYTLNTVPHRDPNKPTLAAAHSNPGLPQRMTEDLVYRNVRSIQVQGIAQHWQLVSMQQKLELNNVKGRWYEASKWLPILQPDNFRRMDEKGDIKELGFFMNSRGDCLKANRDPALQPVARTNVRRLPRRAAFMEAVPPETQIIDGITPPPSTLDPTLGVANNAFNGGPQGSLDHYHMDLDNMEGYGYP